MKFKKCSQRLAVLICTGMLCLGSGAAYAAAEGMKAGYSEVYLATSEAIQEEPAVMELAEHSDDGCPDGIEVVEAAAEQATLRTSNIYWTVAGKQMLQTPVFRGTTGGSITVTMEITPDNKTVSVGIVEPDGTRRYVNGSRLVYHEFKLDQSGSYRVFVQNNNSTAVEVEGSYIVS